MDTLKLSFFARVALAFRVLGNGSYAERLVKALTVLEAKPREEPPEKVHASSLLLLSSLQREGRLVDFLQQDVAGFSDEEVGAAARVVHAGCRKVMTDYFALKPARPEAEGDSVRVSEGFDAQRIRLTGNVTGRPPFQGTLKHHGWVAEAIRMPAVNPGLDLRVVAPAEVEV